MSENSEQFKIDLAARIDWLIALRWFFAAAVIVTVRTASTRFNEIAETKMLYLIGSMIFVYNLIFYFDAARIKAQTRDLQPKQFYRNATAQILVDLSFLTILLHYSGGLHNPFRSFYVFHMIIAGILLSQRAAFLSALFATLSLTTLGLAEFLHILPHHGLQSFSGTAAVGNPTNLAGTLLAEASVLFLVVFMTTSIVKELRQKHAELITTKEALEEAGRELEEVHKMRSEHLVTVTHELKSPLVTIEGYLQLLKSGEEMGFDAVKRSEMIAKALNRTNGLLALIADLLDLAKAKALGSSEPMQIMNACSFLQNIIEFFAPHAVAKSQVLTCKLPCRRDLHITGGDSFPLDECEKCGLAKLKSNKFNLSHLFTNLIGNAIKYTPDRGKIEVSLQRLADGLEFIVIDTGIGIPAEEIPRLFSEFYRCNNAKSYDSAGTGLGLSIVKQIIDSQDGKINVSREPVAGTRFTVFLPANQP